MLNFSRLKIGFILASLLIFFYIFIGNFNFVSKYKIFLDKKVNLGLDLQGGSYLLLEIDINPLLIKKTQEKYNDVKKIFDEKKFDYKNLIFSNNKIQFELKNLNQKDDAINLINRAGKDNVFLNNNLENTKKDFVYRIEKNLIVVQFSDDYIKNLKKDTINQSIEIVRKRVDQLGTKEPSIQQKGDNRIIVELPGLSDPSNFKNILGKTAQLNFKFLKSNSIDKDNIGFEKIKNKADGSFIQVTFRFKKTSVNIHY